MSEEGDLLSHSQVPTPPRGDGDGDPEGTAEEVFSAVADLVTAVAGGSFERLAVCGVGCGGPMSANGETVSPLNIPAWRGFPLRSRLRELTGLEVSVDNDAKALALGEGWRGAARGHDDFMAMVVSTGVGGGLVLDGRLLDGATGNAGHIGHVIVEPGGRLCHCGARGCLEAEASGRAIEEMTGKPAAESVPDVIERCGRMVGLGVASVSNLLDLDLTVVAGSVALGFGEPFFDAARDEISKRSRLAFSAKARIEVAGLGSSGPLIGAAAVGWRARPDGPVRI